MSLNSAAERVRKAVIAWKAVGFLHEGPEAVEYRNACRELTDAAEAGDDVADKDRAKLVEQARELYALGSDDDIEVDEDARFSVAEAGTWVQAWVWVPR